MFLIISFSLHIAAVPRGPRHNECQIWFGELQQFTEAPFHLHPIVHRGHVTSYKVSGRAEGPGDQPDQLQCPHAVLHLCCWSFHLLPHICILAGNTDIVANVVKQPVEVCCRERLGLFVCASTKNFLFQSIQPLVTSLVVAQQVQL